jgi:hypothetical protein
MSKCVAELNLPDEGNPQSSNGEIKLRIESAKAAVALRVSAAKYIAITIAPASCCRVWAAA